MQGVSLWSNMLAAVPRFVVSAVVMGPAAAADSAEFGPTGATATANTTTPPQVAATKSAGAEPASEDLDAAIIGGIVAGVVVLLVVIVGSVYVVMIKRANAKDAVSTLQPRKSGRNRVHPAPIRSTVEPLHADTFSPSSPTAGMPPAPLMSPPMQVAHADGSTSSA